MLYPKTDETIHRLFSYYLENQCQSKPGVLTGGFTSRINADFNYLCHNANLPNLSSFFIGACLALLPSSTLHSKSALQQSTCLIPPSSFPGTAIHPNMSQQPHSH